MYKLVLLPLLFAAVSAGYLGSPAIATYAAGPAIATYAAGPAVLRAGPVLAAPAPLAYGAPLSLAGHGLVRSPIIGAPLAPAIIG